MGSPGFPVEFEVRPLPRKTFQARVFYMSTVGNMDTHMFECKAEVLGWRFEIPADPFLEKKPTIGDDKPPEITTMPKPHRRPCCPTGMSMQYRMWCAILATP